MARIEPVVPFSSGDRRFVLVCLALLLACGALIAVLFPRAFPEASLEFKVDRQGARRIAEEFLARQGLTVADDRFAGIFDADDDTRVYLERTLGLEEANRLYQDPVRLWRWQLRWFQPLRKEEVRVAVTPAGQVVGFRREIDEVAPGESLTAEEARARAEDFLRDESGIPLDDLEFVETSSVERPARLDHAFTWERRSWSHREAPLRVEVEVLGGQVGVFRQSLRVPEAWLRDYRGLRSQNEAASVVATFLYALTGIAAIVYLFRFARLGDIPWRTIGAFAGIGAVLSSANALNALPLALYDYKTTESWGAFLGNAVVGALLGGLVVAVWIGLFGAAGEPLYRRRLPAVPSLTGIFLPRAFGTRAFFRGLLLGYALTVAFMAYQVGFYLLSSHFGAWAPAEVPYSNLLNTRFPWITVLLIGFLPAVSEEFSNRLFSIPFYERLVRNPFLAMVLAGLVWGFLHANYPNQPFWIRGVEVGVAGIVVGGLLYRFGIFPLLVWHYSVDAIYTSLLLLQSGNTYFVVSGAVAAGLLLVPFGVALVLLLRRRGFTADEPFTNAAQSFVPETTPAPDEAPARPVAPPDRRPVPRSLAVGAALAVLVAAVALAWPTDYPPRRLDYPMGRGEALDRARDFVRSHGAEPDSFRHVVVSVSGFDRYGDERNNFPPDVTDPVATRYVAETGGLAAWERLANDVLAVSCWEARFVRPLDRNEWFVIVDPRDRRVAAFRRLFPEEAPGADLEEDDARRAAHDLIAAMGHRPGRWTEVAARSERLTARRDWTFTFADSAARIGLAVPRLSVALAGDRPAGFGMTLHVPESYVRARTTATPLSILLMVVRILLLGGLFGLIAVEVLRVLRETKIPWRFLLRMAGLVAVPAALAQMNQLSALVLTYRSEVPWLLHLLTGSVGLALGVVLQAAFVLVALLVLTAAHPSWRRDLAAAAWPPRAAHALAVVALALAFGVVVDRLELLGRMAWPELWPGPSPPELPAQGSAVPFFSLVWTSYFGALLAGGFLAGMSLVFKGPLAGAAPRAGLALLAGIALCPDNAAGPAEAIVPTLFEAAALLLALIVAFRVAGNNLLAYLAVLPLVLGGQTALSVATQPEVGLRFQGGMAFALLLLPLIALAVAALRDRARPSLTQ